MKIKLFCRRQKTPMRIWNEEPSTQGLQMQCTLVYFKKAHVYVCKQVMHQNITAVVKELGSRVILQFPLKLGTCHFYRLKRAIHSCLKEWPWTWGERREQLGGDGPEGGRATKTEGVKMWWTTFRERKRLEKKEGNGSPGNLVRRRAETGLGGRMQWVCRFDDS